MKVRDIIGDRSKWLTHPNYDSVKPLVSVILPTYSRAKSGLIKKCLDSVLNQSFRRLELIIVDDASVDGTFDICKRYMKNDPRVSIIRHTSNVGLPAVSTYEAYLKARGDYIAYAFDDNQWELDALAQTYDFMEENNVKASYGVTKAMEADGQHFVEFGIDGRNAADSLWCGNFIGAGSVVLHRDVLETVGLHDPHLSLTRVCDWDLWLRIVERFEFVPTGIKFAQELGITQPDSLGNAFKLDQWFLREHQQRRDKKELLTNNYENCDVSAYSENNTSYYLECLCEHYQQYHNRDWFSQSELDQISSTKGNLKVKRVLVICSDLTNSLMTLSAGYHPYIFCISPPGFVLPSYWAMADLVVFTRMFYEETFMLNLLKTLKIPCYYFTDDNFREMAVETVAPDIQYLAGLTTAKTLHRFEGVIVTSEPLRQYFIQKKLHKNVILLGALYHMASAPRPKAGKTVTVGFMGGPFREGVLKSCVLPALQRLAEKRRIRLILPCTKETEKEVVALGEDTIEIIPFHRTSNYEYLLNFYRGQGVDILIHCGRNIRNNLYKTKNALLNASALGAALLVSDIEPYCLRDPGEPDGDYLLTRNTPEEWEKNLRSLMEDKNFRATMVHTAQHYCESQYSAPVVWAEADTAFSKIPALPLFAYLKRYEELSCWIMRNNCVGGSAGAALPVGFRPYEPEKLSFTREMKLPRRFGFTPGVDCIREIGLLFAIVGECVGTVTLQITNRKGELLSERKLWMEELVQDAYTNISLSEALFVRPNQLLYLEILMDYEIKEGYVGLFEDATRRKFLYKVFNRIGHPLPGKNVLFVDCRS